MSPRDDSYALVVAGTGFASAFFLERFYGEVEWRMAVAGTRDESPSDGVGFSWISCSARGRSRPPHRRTRP